MGVGVDDSRWTCRRGAWTAGRGGVFVRELSNDILDAEGVLCAVAALTLRAARRPVAARLSLTQLSSVGLQG